jgi:hypothetical protein
MVQEQGGERDVVARGRALQRRVVLVVACGRLRVASNILLFWLDLGAKLQKQLASQR